MSKLTKQEKEFERLKAAFFEDDSKDPKTGDTVRYNMKPYKALVEIYGNPWEHNPRPVKKNAPKPKTPEEEPKKTKKDKKDSEEESKKTKKVKKDSEEEPKKTKKVKKDSEEEPKKSEELNSNEESKEVKSVKKSGVSEDTNIEFNILDMPIDKIVKKCKSDKVFEKSCNTDFWKLKFHHDHLPIMNDHKKSGNWINEYHLSKNAQSEALKLVKVAIITGTTACDINVELNAQCVGLLPERMCQEEACQVVIACDFDEDNHLGHYTYTDNDKWTMTIENKENTCLFSEVLMFLTKVVYQIINDENIEVFNDNGPLKRKDVEEAGDDAVKQLIAYKMADYNELYQ